MRRWSLFNAELTRSTLVDDGSGDRFSAAAGGLDHVPGVGGCDLDGLQGAVDGVLVGGRTLGTFLFHHADLHLDDLEGVVKLEVTHFVCFGAFVDHAGSAVIGGSGRGSAAGGSVEGALRLSELCPRLPGGPLDAEDHEGGQGKPEAGDDGNNPTHDVVLVCREE